MRMVVGMAILIEGNARRRGKAAGIDDARIVEIFRNGYMGWVYAHLLSLGNVRRLAKRLDRASRVAKEGVLETASGEARDGDGAYGGNGSEPAKKSSARARKE